MPNESPSAPFLALGRLITKTMFFPIAYWFSERIVRLQVLINGDWLRFWRGRWSPGLRDPVHPAGLLAPAAKSALDGKATPLGPHANRRGPNLCATLQGRSGNRNILRWTHIPSLEYLNGPKWQLKLCRKCTKILVYNSFRIFYTCAFSSISTNHLWCVHSDTLPVFCQSTTNNA